MNATIKGQNANIIPSQSLLVRERTLQQNFIFPSSASDHFFELSRTTLIMMIMLEIIVIIIYLYCIWHRKLQVVQIACIFLTLTNDRECRYRCRLPNEKIKKS